MSTCMGKWVNKYVPGTAVYICIDYCGPEQKEHVVSFHVLDLKPLADTTEIHSLVQVYMPVYMYAQKWKGATKILKGATKIL